MTVIFLFACQLGAQAQSSGNWTGGSGTSAVMKSTKTEKSLTATEDEPYSLQLEVVDIDIPYGDKVSFSAVRLPGWLGLSREGLLKGTPDNKDVGMHEIAVRVSDRAGKSDDMSFSVEVVNTNDAPVILTSKLPAARQDAEYAVPVKTEDIDIPYGDSLRFKGVGLPAWLSLSDTGMLSGVPQNQHVGQHEFSVEVSDRAGARAQKSLAVNVENVNDAPVFVKIGNGTKK